MSTFVLNRNYKLILLEGYVSVENEEMEYIEGGATYSGAKGWAVATAMTAIGYGAAYFASSMTAMLLPFGPVGWLVAAISFAPITYIAGQIGNSGAQALWYMLRKGSFTITTNNNPFNLFNVS